MAFYYQNRDRGVIDYKPWLISRNPEFFIRGPRLNQEDLNQGDYFSVGGAAETFGVLSRNPYSTILSENLKIPCLNLGKGGAGVAFFNQPRMEKIIGTINKGKFLILTLMSSRQTSNSIFKTNGMLDCLYDDKKMLVDQAWTLIIDKYWHDKAFLKNFILEVRRAYIDEYLQLLKNISVPVILFYFSQRQPKYSLQWKNKRAEFLWGKFPHLVDGRTIKTIRIKSKVKFVKCVSMRGIPYTLRDSYGNEKPIWLPMIKKFQLLHNYYPSPEMHEDAAIVLEPVCRKILKG